MGSGGEHCRVRCVPALLPSHAKFRCAFLFYKTMTNQTLISAARNILKKLLPSCSQPQINLFNRMYAHKHNASDEYYNSLSIDYVVDKMPVDKLDFAISQVERTIQKNAKQ